MGMINAVLDERVDYGFEGGARYLTNVSDNTNGFVEKDSEWKYGKHEFSASFGDIEDEDRDHIINVFHITKGRHHNFMFKDWNDWEIFDQDFSVGAEGTTETVQAYKMYSGFGQAYTVRPIQALKSASIRDPLGDIVAGDWDLLTGIFTPASPWAAGVHTLDAEFYVWVYFDDDYNPMTINSWRANTAKVSLKEYPLDFFSTNLPASWS